MCADRNENRPNVCVLNINRNKCTGCKIRAGSGTNASGNLVGPVKFLCVIECVPYL